MSIASEISRINTNIAAAYTACSDKSATMPQTQNGANLADTIGSIPTGAAAEAEKKNVNFYDYDGKRLYSYTLQEAAALSALPSLPSRTGFTAQGWNYTLAQIQSEVSDGHDVDVGVIYTTSDGTSRFYITIPTNQYLTVPLMFTFASTGSVTVDWGDGTTTTETSYTSHTYSPSSYPASYVIKVTLISGTLTWGRNGSSVFGSSSQYQMMVTKADIGFGKIGNNALSQCGSLKTINIPNTVSSIGERAFIGCSALTTIIIPNSVTAIYNYAFYDCHSLKKFVIPHSIRGIAANLLADCYALEEIIIPSTITNIDNFAFNGCNSLRSVVIPSSVTVFNALTFGCSHLVIMDLSAFDGSVPRLNGVFSLSETPIFAVKDSTMVSAFESTTNWSNYAGYYVVKDW